MAAACSMILVFAPRSWAYNVLSGIRAPLVRCRHSGILSLPFLAQVHGCANKETNTFHRSKIRCTLLSGNHFPTEKTYLFHFDSLCADLKSEGLRSNRVRDEHFNLQYQFETGSLRKLLEKHSSSTFRRSRPAFVIQAGPVSIWNLEFSLRNRACLSLAFWKAAFPVCSKSKFCSEKLFQEALRGCYSRTLFRRRHQDQSSQMQHQDL